MQGQPLLLCAEVLRSKLLSGCSSVKAWDKWGGKWHHWGHRECFHADFSFSPSLTQKSWKSNRYLLLLFPLIFLACRFPTPSIDFHWLDPHTWREGPPELGRVLPHVLQTLSPIWFFSITRKRRIVGLSCIHILASLLTCCETVSKIFEFSFSSLYWDDKVDLTVVRIEPGT